MKRHSRPEIWAELESTYVEAGTEENWEALFRTIDVFRRVATEVADALRYVYPHDLDREVTSRLHQIKDVEKGAERLLG